MEKVRIGFIGCGGFSTGAVYPSLHHAPVDLAAVCDLDEVKARRNAKWFGADRFYTDRHQMYDKEELDAVFIITGPGGHYPLSIEAMERGYHVFIAKPPANTLEETTEMLKKSEETGKFLMINFQRRFGDAAQMAKEIMDSEEFGTPTHIQAKFCSGHYGSELHYLRDFAIHHFDLIRHFMGDIETVYAARNLTNNQASFAVSLKFKNGAAGGMHLSSQQLWGKKYDRIEITGEENYVILDGLWRLEHYTKNGNRFWEPSPDHRSQFLTGDAYAARHFAESIINNTQPIGNIHDGYEAMKLVKVLHENAGEVVFLDDVS